MHVIIPQAALHSSFNPACGRWCPEGSQLQSHLVVACICILSSPLTLSIMSCLMYLSLALHGTNDIN